MKSSEDNGLSALIVDDEIDTCLLIKMYLKKKGIESFHAHTLQDGFAKAISLTPHPQWIFLDNNLPDGLGIEKLSEFKKLLPNSKIVMITAIGKLKEKALEIGAYNFIEKPLSYASIDNSL